MEAARVATEQEKADLEARLQQAEANAIAAQEKAERDRTALDAAEKARKELEEAKNDNEEILRRVRETALKCNNEKQELDNELDKLTRRIQALQALRAGTDQELKTMKEDISNKDRELSDLNNEIRRQKEANLILAREIQELKKTSPQSILDSIEATKRDVQQIQAKNEEAKSVLDELRNNIAEKYDDIKKDITLIQYGKEWKEFDERLSKMTRDRIDKVEDKFGIKYTRSGPTLAGIVEHTTRLRSRKEVDLESYVRGLNESLQKTVDSINDSELRRIIADNNKEYVSKGLHKKEVGIRQFTTANPGAYVPTSQLPTSIPSSHHSLVATTSSGIEASSSSTYNPSSASRGTSEVRSRIPIIPIEKRPKVSILFKHRDIPRPQSAFNPGIVRKIPGVPTVPRPATASSDNARRVQTEALAGRENTTININAIPNFDGETEANTESSTSSATLAQVLPNRPNIKVGTLVTPPPLRRGGFVQQGKTGGYHLTRRRSKKRNRSTRRRTPRKHKARRR